MAVRAVRLFKGFERVKQTMEKIDERWEKGEGFSFSAHLKDENVVELYSGNVSTFGSDSPLPLDSSHIHLIASTSKAITALVFSLLVEKGLIKYEDKITKYWPEFGKKNKNDVTIRQLLMHRSGLCFFSKKITDKLLLDQEKLSEFLEDQELNWNVLSDRFGFDDHQGVVQGYHAISQGLYLNQICRRVDPQKRTIGQLLREDICDPLDLDTSIGFPLSLQERVVELKQESITKIIDQLKDPSQKGKIPPYNLTNYEKEFYIDLFNNQLSFPHRTLISFLHIDKNSDQKEKVDPKLLSAELPSSNGHSNAKDLSILAALLINKGSYRGTKIWGNQNLNNNNNNNNVLDEMLRTSSDESYSIDRVMKTKVKFTQGGLAELPTFANEEDIFNCRHIEECEKVPEKGYGWGGSGGSLFRIFPDLGLSCAFVPSKNGLRMAMNDPRANALLSSLVRCVKEL